MNKTYRIPQQDKNHGSLSDVRGEYKDIPGTHFYFESGVRATVEAILSEYRELTDIQANKYTTQEDLLALVRRFKDFESKSLQRLLGEHFNDLFEENKK